MKKIWSSAINLLIASGVAVMAANDGRQADAQTTVLSTAPAATAPVTAPAKDDLQVIVDISPKQKEYQVGDTIEISVSLKNVSKRKMTVYKPDGPEFDPKGQLMIWFYFETTPAEKPPAGSGKLEGAVRPGGADLSGRASSDSSFIALKPGESTAPTKYKTVLEVTGKMAVDAFYHNTQVTGREIFDDTPSDTTAPATARAPEPKIEKIPDLYRGMIEGTYGIIISDDPPPEMKDRFDAARQQIDDASVPLADKTALLAKIASEKNVLAGRFILNIWRTTKQPAVKMAALQQWLDMLADNGFSYEGYPDAIKMLADDGTPTEIRARILDILNNFAIYSVVPGPALSFRVDDQAQYYTGPVLGKTTKDAVQAAYNTGEPTLVEKAKPILGSVSKLSI